MSCNMALRRSPKPGALTAAIFRPPRNLFTTPQPTITPENTNSHATVPVTPEVAKSNTNEPSAVIPSEPKPVADTLGIGETKEGTPSEPNPFESTDDLLEDLE